jgi:hypothetical protein
MIAANPLTPADLCGIALEFEDAQARLMGAQAELYQAMEDVSCCRYQLELSRAQRLAEGVDGKNAEHREATLRLNLHGLHETLFKSEQRLLAAKLECEQAKLEWDCLRYRLRAWETALGILRYNTASPDLL